MKNPGRKPALTVEQAAELRRRWALYEANRPAVLAREFGVQRDTVRMYGRDRVKSLWRRPV
jgi:hypothetical protein